jgi:hypothetical protein
MDDSIRTDFKELGHKVVNHIHGFRIVISGGLLIKAILLLAE